MRKLHSSLLLFLFISTVTGDPVSDALFPRQSDCPICVAVAHGIAPANPGPALACDRIETAAAQEYSSLFAGTLRDFSHPSRGPPVS